MNLWIFGALEREHLQYIGAQQPVVEVEVVARQGLAVRVQGARTSRCGTSTTSNTAGVA